MKAPTFPPQPHAAPPGSAVSRVVVHPVDDPTQQKEFDLLIEDKHYIGASPPIGDTLRQQVYLDGQPVALLLWGACVYAFKARDQHIGWNPRMRAQRLKLVVQNRRFLLLTERGEAPNLAALRALPKQWRERFGYEPLAAETFSDIEAFEGTCYKASGWEAVGLSKGYSRHKADFFTPNGRPKKFWFKALRPDALDLLRADTLPPEFAAGNQGNAHGVMPLGKPLRESLFSALSKIPDPRTCNKHFCLPGLLSIVVMAMMCGRKDLSSIQRFGQSLTQAQRKEIGMPRKRGSVLHKIPSYTTLRNLLQQIDPDALGRVLSAWFSAQAGQLPGQLAVDGKMIGAICGVVSVVDPETGVPVAMAPMRHKEEGPDGELTCARTALAHAGDLSGKTISGDALHTETKTARQILDQGGDYLLQVKANQPTLLEHVQRATQSAPFFSSHRTPGMDDCSNAISR
jgi:hypothetical protein